MKTKNFLIIIIVAIVLVSVYYSFQGTTTDEGYITKIEKAREEKNHMMRTGTDSPFAKDSTQSFTSLKYFPVDAAFRINAKLTPSADKKVRILPTSDGKEKRYLEYAFAEFTLDGVENKLLILEIMDMGPYRGTLFLAFSDATSANETYGGGRYLDIKKVPGASSITLDFNESYNPYCAYNDNYSCPFPPVENVLKVAIRAGEMSYHP
jgi:uncharacterized protein (DUF1684 family)